MADYTVYPNKEPSKQARALAEQVERDGGQVLALYQEPVGHRWQIFCLLPLDKEKVRSIAVIGHDLGSYCTGVEPTSARPGPARPSPGLLNRPGPRKRARRGPTVPIAGHFRSAPAQESAPYAIAYCVPPAREFPSQ